MTGEEPTPTIEALARTLWVPLTRFAVRVGALDPEAAVADAFLALPQSLSRLPSLDAARRWLYSVVRNKARTQHRGFQCERKALERIESDSTTARSAEQEAMENLSTQDVHMWLKKLTGRQADIVELRIIHDHSIEMIAEELGITVGTVKSHLFRAYVKLRKGRG